MKETSLSHLPIIGITMGDPSGIGPEIIKKALSDSEIHEICRPVVWGDAGALSVEIVGVREKPIREISNPLEAGGGPEEIDLIGPGVVDVKIVALGKEVGELGSGKGLIPLVELTDLKTGAFTIQIGAFSDKNNALEVADRLKRIFNYIHVAVQRGNGDKALYKVHVSKSKTLS